MSACSSHDHVDNGSATQWYAASALTWFRRTPASTMRPFTPSRGLLHLRDVVSELPRRISALVERAHRCLIAQIGLYEVSGSVPTVRFVPIVEADGAPTPLDLEDALPLACLLTPVADAKDAISAAIDALQAEPYDEPRGAALWLGIRPTAST